MNQDLQLKLQASLDGELSEGEARRLAGWISKDAEAQQLLAELTMAKSAVAGNEPEFKLSESREFYWSKIRREIERAGQVQARAIESTFLDWRKYLTPLAAVTVVALLAIGTARLYVGPAKPNHFSYVAEIESPTEDSSSFAFRSHSENMYVVWVYDQHEEPAGNKEAAEDLEIQ